MTGQLVDQLRLKSTFTVYDCHCEGDVEKVVTSGLPELPKGTVFNKMKHLREHHDPIRKFFLCEPRGSMIQSVNFIVPSEHPDAVAGFIIAESEEYPAMSGGNTMSVATVMLKSGMIPITEPMTRFKLESPAGLIDIECDCTGGRIGRVRIVNQPAFVYCLDQEIDVPGFGKVLVDVAYGGMTYAIVKADQFGFDLDPSEGRRLSDLGQVIKAAAAAQIPTEHPENPEIAGITQTMFIKPIERNETGLISKNAVIVSPGRVDRCPCGTGTSARLAVMHARKQISIGEKFVHKSLIDSTFVSEVTREAKVGNYDGVVPAMSGQAWITAVGNYILEDDDPYPTGYIISDTWPMKTTD